MNNVQAFAESEYTKLIFILGLADDSDSDADYPDAWNFGKTENDFNFTLSDSIQTPVNSEDLVNV